MDKDLNSSFHYQIGGSLPADAPTYIVRQADRDLFDALLTREYCYVLNARQMGKSSLRVKTMSRLKAQGIACSEVELSGIGSQQITSQQWYGGIIQEIIDGFELKVNRKSWLKERDDLSPMRRLGEFIETVLLRQIEQNIVIFIDEIDSILSLEFPTDDFLTLIHSFYNKRANKPEYRRLTFVLMGVATPTELFQDIRSTPFNIGRAIELKGFQLSECASLVRGFGDRFEKPQQILAQILSWTGGQPFLTQKLCRLIAQNPQVIDPQSLDDLVQSQIINNWEAQDNPEHLKTIRDRLCRFANRSFSTSKNNSSQKLLKIYRRILRRGRISFRNYPEHLELKLSGAVAQDKDSLIIKNDIYQAVFNQSWVEGKLDELSGNEYRQISLKKTVLISLAIASLMVGVRSLGWLQPWELKSFDLMMRLRPKEKLDERLLIVNVTEDDVQSQPAIERGGSSISDRSLAKLLTKLEQSSARAIGLDIYREVPLATEYQAQIAKVRQSDRFFAICQYGTSGVAASPQVISGDGFNNLLLDDSDQVIRRQILAVSSAFPCRSKYSFSWHLATYYLAGIGIEPQNIDNNLQLGNTTFKSLNTDVGSYQNLNNEGNQILLNCRNSDRIARSFTLQEILESSFDLNLVKNRIVIIGTTDPSFNDHRWRTTCSNQETGVGIQAQMVSQILSSVLDRRPLIWSPSQFWETIWIIGCSLAGGIIVYYRKLKIETVWYISFGIVLIYSSCELALVALGSWLPICSSILVLIIASSTVAIYEYTTSGRD
ncbi:MAG: CHASE2 domain-containing protein [Waterburya sp.]